MGFHCEKNGLFGGLYLPPDYIKKICLIKFPIEYEFQTGFKGLHYIFLLFCFSADVRNFNAKNGLTLKCRYRLYGDHRKEQLEKYKNSNISKIILFLFEFYSFL